MAMVQSILKKSLECFFIHYHLFCIMKINEKKVSSISLFVTCNPWTEMVSMLPSAAYSVQNHPKN